MTPSHAGAVKKTDSTALEGVALMADRSDIRHKPVVYAVAGMDRVRIVKDVIYKHAADDALEMDVYAPADLAPGDLRPAVMYVNGDAGPALTRHAKDMGAYLSWGRLAAARGLVGVTFNHRSAEGWTKPDRPASDVDDLIGYVRASASRFNIDADRLCIWTCSGGPPFGLRTALRDRPSYVRCIVAYYGVMDLQHLRTPDDPDLSEETARAFSPVAYLGHQPAHIPPLFVVKAGLDHALVNASIDRFVMEALHHNVMIDVLTHPAGHHSFDILDDTPRSHVIIRQTLDFMARRLFLDVT